MTRYDMKPLSLLLSISFVLTRFRCAVAVLFVQRFHPLLLFVSYRLLFSFSTHSSNTNQLKQQPEARPVEAMARWQQCTDPARRQLFARRCAKAAPLRMRGRKRLECSRASA